jgi:K+-sensing histidine kinase KdpD
MLAAPGAYAFAIMSVAVCTLVRWLLTPLLENEGLYLAFMIPVASSAYVGGPGPGLVSAVLSAAIASPVLAQFPVPDEHAGIAHLVLFGIDSAAVILLIRKLQQSRDEARQEHRFGLLQPATVFSNLPSHPRKLEANEASAREEISVENYSRFALHINRLAKRPAVSLLMQTSRRVWP